MKNLSFVISLVFLSGCVSHKLLLKDNIRSVSILFKDNTWGHHDGYKLYDGTVIRWDKKNVAVKAALNKYSDKLELLKKEQPDYLADFITTKNIKYMPIKVVPLKEFGYIEMNSSQLIFYGIMGDKTFIDLTNNRVYINDDLHE